MSRSTNVISIIAMSLMLVLLGAVIWHLLFRNDPTPIVIQASDGTADFDATTAASYGSRIANVAELTIVSILTLGGALIGLNWFTSHRNYLDERERFADERREASEQVSTAVQEVTKQLRPISEDLSSLREEQDSKHQQLSEAIASAIFSSYTTAYASIARPTITQIQYPLMVLMQAPHALEKLDHTSQVKDVARQAVNQFLGRYSFATESDESWDISDFENFLIAEVSKVVITLLDPNDAAVQNWFSFITHFYVAEGRQDQSNRNGAE